jgi:Uncharacterized protein conserved in bacteria
MLSYDTFLINAVVGAVIGAGTNDLAIRAIFRYIIPRKKSTIAQAIQRVVSRDLLSPEKITAKFASPGMRGPLRDAIAKWLDGLLDRELPSWVELTEAQRETFSPREDTLLREGMERLFAELSSEEFRVFTLKPFLERRWRDFRNKKPGEIHPGFAPAVASALSGMIHGQLENERTLDGIQCYVTARILTRMEMARTLSEATPGPLRASLSDWIVEQAPLLVDLLAASLENRKTQEAFVAIAERALQNQQNTGILDSVKSLVIEQIADVRGMIARLPDLIRTIDPQEIQTMLRQSIGELWSRDWRQFMGQNPQTAIGNAAETLLAECIHDRNIEALDHAVTDWAEGIASREIGRTVAELPGLEYPEYWLDALSHHVQRLLCSPVVRLTLEEQASCMFSIAKAKPIGRPGRFVTQEMRENIVDVFTDYAVDTVKSRLSGFAEQPSMWDIVGESINQFDNKGLERLIREIASRELGAVTWMGGVLGAFMGLLQTFLQNW